MGNDVIKKYIWEAETGSCERCQALDGTEYQNAEDVPDRPHPNCKCNVREIYEDLVFGLEQVMGTFGDFVSNWAKMLEMNKQVFHEGTPEYYHSKANCEATQRGEIGEATSEILGETRKFFDYYKDIYLKGKSAQQASFNNDYDFAQNKAGRIFGKEHPDQSCEDILKYRRPKDLPKDSW